MVGEFHQNDLTNPEKGVYFFPNPRAGPLFMIMYKGKSTSHGCVHAAASAAFLSDGGTTNSFLFYFLISQDDLKMYLWTLSYRKMFGNTFFLEKKCLETLFFRKKNVWKHFFS